MVGSATFTIVRSTIVMKYETASIVKARQRWIVVIRGPCLRVASGQLCDASRRGHSSLARQRAQHQGLAAGISHLPHGESGEHEDGALTEPGTRAAAQLDFELAAFDHDQRVRPFGRLPLNSVSGLQDNGAEPEALRASLTEKRDSVRVVHYSAAGSANAANSSGCRKCASSAIAPSSTRSTQIANARYTVSPGSRQYSAKAGCRFAAVGSNRHVVPISPNTCSRRKIPIASRPLNHVSPGGMTRRASSRSSAISAAVSERSQGVISCCSKAFSVASELDVHSPRPTERCSPSVACARWSALLTATWVMSSAAAVSLADQSSTSRRISTARCRDGRRWIAARNASSTVSLAVTTASGSASGGAGASGGRSG